MKRLSTLAIFVASLTLAASACKKKEETKKEPTTAAPADPAGKPVEPAAAPTPEPAAAMPGADFTTTAKEIYAEFRPQIEAGKADEVRAKYTGKNVKISGEVKSNADMMGTWELALKADDETGQAFLHPAANAAEAFKAIKPGATATFQCVSEGWEIGPQFKECVVVP